MSVVGEKPGRTMLRSAGRISPFAVRLGAKCRRIVINSTNAATKPTADTQHLK